MVSSKANLLTVSSLIEVLSEIAEEGMGDMKVYIETDKNYYPIQTIAGVKVNDMDDICLITRMGVKNPITKNKHTTTMGGVHLQ